MSHQFKNGDILVKKGTEHDVCGEIGTTGVYNEEYGGRVKITSGRSKGGNCDNLDDWELAKVSKVKKVKTVEKKFFVKVREEGYKCGDNIFAEDQIKDYVNTGDKIQEISFGKMFAVKLDKVSLKAVKVPKKR